MLRLGLASAIIATGSAYAYHQWQQTQPVKGYKAFGPGFRCRGFQYEVGKTYELPEGQEAQPCVRGFHYCLIPYDVNNYYSRFMGPRYAEVEAWGSKHIGDKSVAPKIRIVREISAEEWGKLSGVFKGRSRTVYLKDGDYHREDGPAIIERDGFWPWARNKEWYQKGQRHRLDGPAYEGASGTKEWWREGVRYNEDGTKYLWAS